jgi:ligand-binding SRPBCC domain-containing protein
MYTLERAQIIPAPVPDVFRFFENPYNLRLITPDWLDFRVLRIDGLPLRAGTRMYYRIRWLGIPLRWETLIHTYEPQRRFIDVQTSGPYFLWFHEHTFSDLGEATLMRDHVLYDVPYGIWGKLLHRLLIGRQIRAIFDYRASKIRAIFTPSGSQVVA